MNQEQTYKHLVNRFSLSLEKQREIEIAIKKEREKQSIPRLTYQIFLKKIPIIGLCIVALVLIFLGIQKMNQQTTEVLVNPIENYQNLSELKKNTPFELKTSKKAGNALSYSLIDRNIVEITYSNNLSYRAGKQKLDVLGGLEQSSIFESITDKKESYDILKQGEVLKGIFFKRGKIYYLFFSENGRSLDEWLTLAQSIDI